jgi:hypothetical protein
VYIPFFESTSDLYPELDNPVAIGFFVRFLNVLAKCDG